MAYTDRSRIELGWLCPRARYLGYEYHNIGLAPQTTNKDLNFGLLMAEQTANIKLDKPVTTEKFVGEEKALADALLTGYKEVVWPRWVRDYELLAVEKEMPLLLTDWLTYNTRPDTVMRRRVDGTVWYGPEDKTTGYIDSLLNYANSVQLHATAFAIEDNLKESVAGCLVQGLYKGFEKEKKLYHPLVYAYMKEGRAGIVPNQWSAKWVRTWERTPIAYYPGGVSAWIKQMAEEDLVGVFPNSEPVMIKRPFVKSYLAQVVQRESEIEAWRQDGAKTDEETLNRVFPQHFNQCDSFSKGRAPCQFKDACFSPTAKKFPLTFYKYRVPHHENEQEALSGSGSR